MNVYLIVTMIRLLVVAVAVLAIVAAAAWADLRRRRRLGDRSEAATPRIAATGVTVAPACECQVSEDSAVRASPGVIERTLHRRAA